MMLKKSGEFLPSSNNKVIIEISNLELSDLDVETVQKKIKNIHLSVYPPDGRVRVSAPINMSKDIIRVFVISKLEWIRKQQLKFCSQEREARREYIDRESQYVWGKRYLLKIEERNINPKIELKRDKLVLLVRSGTSQERKRAVLEAWYRGNLKQTVPSLIKEWQACMAVQVKRFYI